MAELIEGFSTPEGTRRFREKAEARGEADTTSFRSFDGLSLSSLGIGTYLGKDDDATDALYEEAVGCAIAHGINVIDTASNYRHQRSERAIGRALSRAVASERSVRRDEVLIASKAGFLSFDNARPANARKYFEDTFVRPGIFRWEEIVGGCQCLSPRYLHHQIDKSRKNLGLSTIDVYYLHNPEMQLDEVPLDEFLRRIRAAFEALEQAVQENKIRWYGTATWSGYRVPSRDLGHLSLEALLDAAKDVAGDAHRFRFVQLPLNLSMTEAADALTQSKDGRAVSLLQAAEGQVYVMTSASIMQGKLAVPARDAIQFVRSIPGVGTALVGMKKKEHVLENVSK